MNLRRLTLFLGLCFAFLAESLSASRTLADLGKECRSGRRKSACSEIVARARTLPSAEERSRALSELSVPYTEIHPNVRADEKTQTLLGKLALTDPDARVRAKACEYLTDQKVLAEIARAESSFIVRSMAIPRLTDQAVLAEIACSDPDGRLRLAAVAGVSDQASLQMILQRANDAKVQYAAVQRFSDPTALRDLALNHADPILRINAASGLADRAKDPGFQRVIAEVVLVSADTAVRERVARKLDDEIIRTQVALHDPDWTVRLTATRGLKDQAVLAMAARNDENANLRRAVVERLTHQGVLAEVARKDADHNVRIAATSKLENEAILAILARTDENASVRRAAVERLTDQSVLAEVARKDTDHDVRIAAVESAHLTDEAVLRAAMLEDESDLVRIKAIRRLKNTSHVATVVPITLRLEFKTLAYHERRHRTDSTGLWFIPPGVHKVDAYLIEHTVAGGTVYSTDRKPVRLSFSATAGDRCYAKANVLTLPEHLRGRPASGVTPVPWQPAIECSPP